ncbi:MAG: SDR family NAD(P)-dependent oxidoreductase [Gammaproteobacteria bacterium]|jgi:NAD(P)-dependent dehydrogenase (short-subunit alcohol dehydrogenase family)|nr:SDR family NAD(P)-dependent oxidoreductase [Gammaproteobacteria bacterium]
MTGICAGRVAIVTGAGGGLGAAHARALAAAGAKVIVNDIDIEAAAKVVEDIVDQGGAAEINRSDITDYESAEEAVRQALDSFGDLHCVVNNAGNNRDRMFASLSEADWDAVIAVHLKGHFCITSHAVQYWRHQVKSGQKVSGRIVNTTSGAGLQGSIGQSNYAAAKAGIAALTINQGAELARYGVTANAICPVARTGMTTAVPEMAARMAAPEDGSFDHFAPENVSAVVVWLCSEDSAGVTGKIIEAEGGRIALADGWRSTEGVSQNARWEPSQLGSVMARLLEQETPPQKVWGS